MRKIQFCRTYKKYTVLPGICLAAFLCCGCGMLNTQMTEPEAEKHETVKVTSMESTAIIDYTVPQLVPNVLVNLAGYQADRGKCAEVKGGELPKLFHLVDADTGEVVFTGKLEDEEYNADLGLYTAIADFSSWTREGRYYVECEHIGRSYPFSVEENLYMRLFGENCEIMFSRCKEQSIALWNVEELLLIYEWYPEICPDENGNEIPDVLDRIAAWISETAEMSVESGQEALYATVLAKFSYLYQNYDRQYATDCLKRSSVVYDQIHDTLQKDAECFYALTELYRATGLYTYGKQIEEYKSYFDNHTNFTEEPGYLYGAMTYLATRRQVNVSLCELLMSTIMAEAEEIGDVYKEMLSPVNARNNGETDLLRHAMDIACANYVMNNPQYNRVVEEFLHYLRGRNRQSVDFFGEGTEEKEDGGYLILLAQLTAVQNVLSK